MNQMSKNWEIRNSIDLDQQNVNDLKKNFLLNIENIENNLGDEMKISICSTPRSSKNVTYLNEGEIIQKINDLNQQYNLRETESEISETDSALWLNFENGFKIQQINSDKDNLSSRQNEDYEDENENESINLNDLLLTSNKLNDEKNKNINYSNNKNFDNFLKKQTEFKKIESFSDYQKSKQETVNNQTNKNLPTQSNKFSEFDSKFWNFNLTFALIIIT